MAEKDKIKWNKKYMETPHLLKKRDPSKKLIETIVKVKGKKVLDIACGAGKNSIYLAKKGFEIEALDISNVALENLDKKGFENIITKQVDLEGFIPKENSYDFIVKTNYLDRNIIPHLKKSLKKDGILFIETYMNHKDNEKAPSNPDFLLNKDELKRFLDKDFELLDYDEFDNEEYELYRMKKQSIVIRKL